MDWEAVWNGGEGITGPNHLFAVTMDIIFPLGKISIVIIIVPFWIVPQVTIGNNVLFGPNVSLLTAGHPIRPVPRNEGIEYAFPITIGNNVWIGGGVIVNPGITIGDNVVIGSGSVVTKDIPPNVIAVGNPCKVLKEITDEDRNNILGIGNFKMYAVFMLIIKGWF